MHKGASSQRRLLPVDVSNNGASVMVTVGKSNAPPPYRIENRQGLLMLLCRLTGVCLVSSHHWACQLILTMSLMPCQADRCG